MKIGPVMDINQNALYEILSMKYISSMSIVNISRNDFATFHTSISCHSISFSYTGFTVDEKLAWHSTIYPQYFKTYKMQRPQKKIIEITFSALTFI
uniref:Uncharacterized protein n=1 Tax=Arundo donax TaxID=35708 RepID=A0A0A9CJ93_ARUDO